MPGGTLYGGYCKRLSNGEASTFLGVPFHTKFRVLLDLYLASKGDWEGKGRGELRAPKLGKDFIKEWNTREHSRRFSVESCCLRIFAYHKAAIVEGWSVFC